ncbi:MAG: hypothetical protein K2X47_06805, partial [Bdellovibrionales bacterium]|nr:hypothetical protein [Bdellovibrionales bacterium]
IFIFGISAWIKNNLFQKRLDRLKLGGDRNTPRVVKVIYNENKKIKLVLYSAGVGADKYETRKSDLEAALKHNIESIRAQDGSPHMITIVLSKVPLASIIYFDEFEHELKNEGEFLVGQSRQGFVVQNIAELPHVLIAGTSGGGKSVFFKQALIGLMQSTPNSKFYLLDFKKGVEFGVFSGIPDVEVVKTKDIALVTLKAVKSEMQSRFDYLELHKRTKLNSELDKQPRIFVGIDEASELLAIPDRFNPDKNQILECRGIINDLAKLGRAANIHLMIATQKVSKQILDTSLQENIGGRMAFRMATMSNSVQVLGTKDASELSEVKGRAIWQFGTRQIEVQVPYLNEKELDRKIKAIADFRANASEQDAKGSQNPNGKESNEQNEQKKEGEFTV